MRWRRLAFWITFSTVALIVLALSWLLTADLGVFKPRLERYVTEEFGREFEIRGELHVDLSRHTTVIAEDVRLGNAEWAEADDMISVGRAEVRFDLWSLVAGPVLVELVDLDDTRILLLNPGDEAPNWTPFIEDDDADSDAGIDLLIGVIDVDRMQVQLESVERDRPLSLVIERLDQSYRDDDYLDLEMRATLDGRAVAIDGAFGTWDALLEGKDFSFDLDAVLDTFKLSARGRVDDVNNLRRPEFRFSATGPDIDDLTRMLGLGEEGEGDIRLSGELAAVGDDALVLEVKGNLGLTEIDVSGEVADLQSLEDLRLEGTASGPELGRVLRLAGIHGVRQTPFMLQFEAEMKGDLLEVRKATMVFADARMEGTARLPRFPTIDDAVISLQLEGDDIEQFRYVTGIRGAASGPFSLGLTVDVREDGVEVMDLSVKTALGEIHGSGRVGDPDTFLGTELNIDARTGNLARLAAAYGAEDLPDTPAELSGLLAYTRDGIRIRGPLTVVIDGISAEADGLVALEEDIRGTDLAVNVAGDDLARLVAMFTEPAGVPALPFDIGGRLRVRSDGFHISDTQGSLGTASLSADGLLVPADMIAGSRFDFTARGDNFEELFAGFDELDVGPGPFELRGRIAFRAEAIVLQDVELDRRMVDARLEMTIGRGGEQALLDFDVSANGSDVRSVLDRVKGFQAFEQPFSLEARGQLRGPQWSFDELDVTVGDATIDATGDLELVDAQEEATFSVTLQIPSLATIGTVDGHRFREQGLSLTADVSSGDGRLATENIEMRIGSSDVHGTVVVHYGDIPRINIDVYSDRLVYLSPLEEAGDFDPEPEFDDGRLIPDVAIPFELLKRVNGTLAVEIEEFQRDKLYLSEIDVDAQLQDGTLDIGTIYFKTLSGALRAKASLVSDGVSGRASMQLVARDFAPGLREQNKDLAMTTDADIDLVSTGADLRSLAGNANGTVYVDIRGGRMMVNEMVTAIYGNTLEEMLNTINPLRKADAYTDFECMIAPLLVEDGKVSGAPSIFVSTETIRAVTQGWVNLKTEELKVGVRTTPRRVVSVSAAELFNPYLQVVGTLASPRLAVDETGVLITGGAAVATGGLSLLARGLWDRISKSGDACKQMSEQALKTLEGRLPDLVVEIPTPTE